MITRKRTSCTGRAFTITEILVVLAIIALLAGLGITAAGAVRRFTVNAVGRSVQRVNDNLMSGSE